MSLSAETPVITGRGMYLPEEVLTNRMISKLVDPDQLRRWVEQNRWCQEQSETALGGRRRGQRQLDRELFVRYVDERIGIRQRHVVDLEAIRGRRPPVGKVFGSDLGANAARRALDAAQLSAADVDLIICGTSSPDRIYPPTSIEIQERLGARRAYAYDLLAACSSFVYALHTAQGLIRSGASKRVLIVTAEYFTCGVDYRDPCNSFFWGDAAAAVVVQAAGDARCEPLYELLDVQCRSTPSQNIRTGLGGTRPFVARSANGHGAPAANGAPAYPFFFQNGPMVYREVIPLVVEITRETLERNGFSTENVRQFMFHQPSRLFLQGIVKRLLGAGGDPERIPTNFEQLGNTSSCAVAICLVEESVMRAGEIACMTAFGAGYTVGSALLRRL